MQDLYIEFLPPWVETNLQPAFYDVESGTVLQQTARMYGKINEIIKIINDYRSYDEEIEALQRDMALLRTEMTSFENSVDAQLINMYNSILTLINNKIGELKRYSDEKDEELKAYVDDALINKVMVYNPINGLHEDIQTVIYALYDVNRTDALTATEYDALELTATEYDAEQITASDYDLNGKTILTQ